VVALVVAFGVAVVPVLGSVVALGAGVTPAWATIGEAADAVVLEVEVW
jgi:hypothetical protein